MSERVVLAMSGGVDSSAAAVLLQRSGYEVVGLFMRSGATEEVCATDLGGATGSLLPVINAKPHKQGCCSASDAADARRVADSLDIPFHALNFQDAFGRIKDYFADEYLAGRTPNPCVMCNNWLKFGRLWEFAQSVGATKIASGHYARVETVDHSPRDGGQCETGDGGSDCIARLTPSPALLRGVDRGKDQSYVLFGLDRDLLANVLFPVGELTKPKIRELAGEAGLRVANKPDSQEICFIPDNDYAGFLSRYRSSTSGKRERPKTAGELVDTQGNVLGEHPGYEKFTIGQRRGLGIAVGAPRFVVRIEPETKRVVIGTHEELGRTELVADRANWLVEMPDTFRCTAQIRYQHRPAWAEVTRTDADRFHVAFDEPQFGVAPGQACVLYDDDRVLGGGWIT